MEPETAGDPITGLRWTRKTTAKIAAELRQVGIDVCPSTVGRLLKKMGFSLRVNHKKLSRVCKTSPGDRDAQFARIAQLRKDFAARCLPVISVDTKKKELVGCFKNAGTAWGQQSVEVKDHDFLSEALGKAVPYGIYDLQANRGTVVVGTTRLIGRDVRFGNLGLIVVDEEHRFGVRQKERLKKLRAEVDVLSMSATPIPRTLQMGLSGIRDMSLMATPPAELLVNRAVKLPTPNPASSATARVKRITCASTPTSLALGLNPAANAASTSTTK